MNMDDYVAALRDGAHEYADVLNALADAGLPGQFTQTGGMNAALFVPLPDGRYLLVTDANDALAWARAAHEGWHVGLYDSEDSADNDDHHRACSESHITAAHAHPRPARSASGRPARVSTAPRPDRWVHP